jgi:hypothetical protein
LSFLLSQFKTISQVRDNYETSIRLQKQLQIDDIEKPKTISINATMSLFRIYSLYLIESLRVYNDDLIMYVLGLVGQIANQLNHDEDESQTQHAMIALCFIIGGLKPKEVEKFIDTKYKDVEIRQALYDTTTQAVSRDK